jgi:hypothetical protein
VGAKPGETAGDGAERGVAAEADRREVDDPCEAMEPLKGFGMERHGAVSRWNRHDER